MVIVETPVFTILLLFMYPKNDQDDLAPEQLRRLRTIVEEEYRGR
jgi:hypothetical protein